MALFCPSCPQPEINLQRGWQNDLNEYLNFHLMLYNWNLFIFNSWLYQRSYVVEGNFHADHVKMKQPDDDVALCDGLGFMVETKPYNEHLKESIESKQVCLF